MRAITPVLSLLLALPLVSNAYADNFSGSGGGFSGSGTLTGTGNGDGSYTITDVSGSGFGTLFAPGGYQQNDNQLFPGAPSLVDGQGFAFTYTEGDTNFDVDIFSVRSGAYTADYTDLDSNLLSSIGVTFTLTATPQMEGLFLSNASPATESFAFSFGAASSVTPEPASLFLLGTGALGLLGSLRRRWAGARQSL